MLTYILSRSIGVQVESGNEVAKILVDATRLARYEFALSLASSYRIGLGRMATEAASVVVPGLIRIFLDGNSLKW